MKPLQHAKISAHKHGGKWEDYLDIHEWFDQTKAHIPDMRHRAILHNAFGIYLCRQVFGEVRMNSAGREYSVRDIGEDHVLQDLGTIPTIHDVISAIDFKHLKWLGGIRTKKVTILKKNECEIVDEESETIEVDEISEPTDALDNAFAQEQLPNSLVGEEQEQEISEEKLEKVRQQLEKYDIDYSSMVVDGATTAWRNRTMD